MNREQFKVAFEDTLKDMHAIMERKNADYATDENPFGNFRLVEELSITTLANGILVRMSDKMSRISNLIGSNKEAKVKDESVADTLQDLANYAVILKVYLDSQKPNNEDKPNI